MRYSFVVTLEAADAGTENLRRYVQDAVASSMGSEEPDAPERTIDKLSVTVVSLSMDHIDILMSMGLMPAGEH